MKILTILLVMATACTALAGIEWTWVNAGTGTEQGTFVTDGELVGDLAPAGTYTVMDFTLTATAYTVPLGSISGGVYWVNDPETGFDWDGAAPTVFWRASGMFTNGLNVFVKSPLPDEPDWIAFSIDWFYIGLEDGDTAIDESQTVILTPVGTITAHERGTFGGVKALYR